MNERDFIDSDSDSDIDDNDLNAVFADINDTHDDSDEYSDANFFNPDFNEYDDHGGKIGCEDCALGLCDCGYDFD
ncbi:MAG: hypothetical protein FWG45_03620 [Oscillospiraceae bacterium]|nr:hypothetical protein [Oscillospiraceae bacterium]